MTSHVPIAAARDGCPEDAYLSIRVLARYSGLSIRTLRERLRHSDPPLPHYRVGSKILVKRSEFDGWIRAFRATTHHAVNELVTSLLRSL
jgi:excisionase family DNA binding protein